METNLKKLVVATIRHPWYEQRLDIFAQMLQRIGCRVAFFLQETKSNFEHLGKLPEGNKLFSPASSPLQTTSSEKSNLEELYDLLLSRTADVLVYPLEELPFEQPKGIVIAGVSARETTSDALLFRLAGYDPDQLFGLRQGAVVLIKAAHYGAQLKDFRPDLQFEVCRHEPFLFPEILRLGMADAALMPGWYMSENDCDGLHCTRLNPREIVPFPAQGVMAWLCCEKDINTRRLLRQLHHPTVSALTNIERRVMQSLYQRDHSLPFVHCIRDSAGNYHAYAACAFPGSSTVRRASISQSTTVGLAQKMVNLLSV